MIQQLRQGAAGYNPFIVIIVTAWEKSIALITRVVNSGADDLLLRPFSTALLGARIEAHIERRKGFVITTDYVGPDRRQRCRPRRQDVEMFDPPNSLKMKAKDRLSAEAIAKRLDAELQSGARQADRRKAAPRFLPDLHPVAADAGTAVRRSRSSRPISRKLGNLTKCDRAALADTEPAKKRVEWCDSILAAAEGLKRAWTATPRCICWAMPRSA